MTEEKKQNKKEKKQEVEDKSGEEEDDELSKAGILLVTDGSSWLERRKEGGGGGGASVTAVFNINNFCRAASCSDARTLALKAGTVDSSVQQNPARRVRRGRRVRRSTLRGGKNMDLAADAC